MENVCILYFHCVSCMLCLREATIKARRDRTRKDNITFAVGTLSGVESVEGQK